jgi:pilus assembly protein CpaE
MARERTEEDAAARTGAVLEDIERSWASSHTATRIAVGIHDLGLHQEVQDFLGRDPKLELVGAAADADRLVAMLGERSPDVALVCPTIGRELRHPAVRSSGCPVVVVAEEVTVPILRGAIEAGAQAVFGWPDERAQLARSLAAFRTLPRGGATTRAMVVAVLGARGGAGATFVATHLAAAFAGTGLRTALVDLDVSFADVSAALGIGGSSEVAVRTIQDLLPVMDELSPAHLADVLFRHDRGFAVLLGPPESREPVPFRPGLYRGAIALLAGEHDAVVLHLPRAVDRVARAGAELADRTVLVTTLDLFALYGARRSMALLDREVNHDRWRVVLNKPARSALTERDVERVLGVRPIAVIRPDARVGRVQARGELLAERTGGAARDVRKVAALLVDEQGERRTESPA